jgi:hypothetical protein
LQRYSIAQPRADFNRLGLFFWEFFWHFCFAPPYAWRLPKAAQNTAALRLSARRFRSTARSCRNLLTQERYSPDAALMKITGGGLEFQLAASTKTMYNNIDRGNLEVTRKDLPYDGLIKE